MIRSILFSFVEHIQQLLCNFSCQPVITFMVNEMLITLKLESEAGKIDADRKYHVPYWLTAAL